MRIHSRHERRMTRRYLRIFAWFVNHRLEMEQMPV